MKKLILEVWEAIKLIPGWFEDEEVEMEIVKYDESKEEPDTKEIED